MDNTIWTVHKGQTLNDKNIQLMMKKMDLFGEQMLLLQQQMTETPKQAHATPNMALLNEKDKLPPLSNKSSTSEGVIDMALPPSHTDTQYNLNDN